MPIRPIICFLCATLGLPTVPALAQTTLFGDHVIVGDLSVDEGITGSLYVEDDSVIDGSLCLGNACLPTTTFANDETLKMIYTQHSIVFDDTSSSTNPNRDWTLRINDPQPRSSGGIDKFAVEDDTAGTTPFTIEGGAPDNALWIDDTGRIGMGTMFPQARLHIETTDTFGLRLSRSGSGAWDAAVTATGSLALSNDAAGYASVGIDEDAPQNALVIGDNAMVVNGLNADYDFVANSATSNVAFVLDGATGNVGIGIGAAMAPLHVRRSDNSAGLLIEDTGASGAQEMLKLSNNGGSYFTFENAAAGTTWFFTHEDASPNRFIIADAVADGPEMSLTADGDLTIPGQLFTAGSCAAGCDRVFDADYPLPTIAEQAAMMRANKHLPAVGPTPEDGPFNITAMTGGMLNELEKAHLYIAELDGRMAAERVVLQAALSAERARVAALEDRLTRLEALLAGR
ncbi:hypothetical protein ACOXXX_18325 [Thalassococcus sp. BH17M4-6]|uniref:hypothetical protein n=1 Tax=Thalassococcus sp. BH17M4-6 TaxID=3413148 RepID=UPI003BE1B04E